MGNSTSPKREIVFVNQSSGYLMIDIVNAYRHRYGKRTLLAGSLNPRSVPLDEDVRIHRIMAYRRSSVISRLIPWLTGFFQTLVYILIRKPGADLFLVSNPPFTTFVPLFCRNSFTLLIYDIFPDTLVEKGILGRKSLLVRWWARANRRVFRKAREIVTLSEGMKSVLSQYVEEDKIRVIPLWSDSSFLHRIPEGENKFMEGQNLGGKFVVLYSGNLGKSHHVDVLLELAERMNSGNVFFLIIGSGAGFQVLEKQAQRLDLPNLRILPWQETEMLPYTLNSACLGVVALDNSMSKLSVPSKMYDLISAGVPIMGLAGEESELHRMVEEHQLGACFSSDQVRDMESFILQLACSGETYKNFRRNARAAAKNHTSANAGKFTEG